VIVADPAAFAVTSPLAFTVATTVLLLAQLTTRPVSGAPLESRGVAGSCPVCATVRLRLAGVTSTVATGLFVTVTAALPLCPSLVAVIVADPAAFAVTSPLAFTVATTVLLLAHVTTRPASGAPLESRGVAVSCPVCATVRLRLAGVTSTVATGLFVTVTVALPLCPSLVAVIVADPAAFAVTSPLALTVATTVLLLAHVTTRPASGAPLESRGVAVNCPVCATVRPRLAGVTSTLATGVATGWLVTLTAALPLRPSLVAVIVADPAAFAVTSPLPSTVATAVLLLAHVTTRPVSGAPLESRGVAVNWPVCATVRLRLAGVTSTVATGAGTGSLVTLTAAPPLRPSLVAVIVADPPAFAVTSPVPSTVATPGLSLAHVTARLGRAFPAESRGMAASCAVCPTCTLTLAGVTVTEATGRRRIRTHEAAESLSAALVAET